MAEAPDDLFDRTASLAGRPRTVAELPRTQTQRVEKYRLREEAVTEDTYDGQPQEVRV